MGIPSYFSYIIKNHSNIIRNLKYHNTHAKTVFHGLYMDCNSVIYDAVHSVEKNVPPPSKYQDPQSQRRHFEQSVIDMVVLRIREYVQTISPTNVLYIAFDGVAPLAKMDQQRARRHKTAFLSSITFDRPTQPFVEPGTGLPEKWNTSAITPGTLFMESLSKRIHHEFHNGKAELAKISHVIVSTSTDVGEGEHKMFAYLRNNAHLDDNIAVYGLDSDLIMLSILHSVQCRNIFIFRESPQFSKSVLPVHLRSDIPELLFLDIRQLTLSILGEMNRSSDPRNVTGIVEYDTQRIYDYILISVLLGNDFLPHMVSLNLRGTGMEELLQLYAEHIAKRRVYLVSSDRTILWKNLRYFVGKLAAQEHRNIMSEFEQRAKMAKRKYPESTAEEREFLFQKTPLVYRGEEEYICPTEENWETRYYRVCFPESFQGFAESLRRSKSAIFRGDNVSYENLDKTAQVCTNYLEGMEWVFRYYSEGCPHWRWKYHFHYPPLLADLYKHIPENAGSLIANISYPNRPFHPMVQLSYVTPPSSHSLLPNHMVTFLRKRYSELFATIRETKFTWMFCKYFWESHVILPAIPMHVLEEWETRVSGRKKDAKSTTFRKFAN